MKDIHVLKFENILYEINFGCLLPEFYTPEEFFLGEDAAEFSWGSLDPQEYLKSAKEADKKTYHSKVGLIVPILYHLIVQVKIDFKIEMYQQNFNYLSGPRNSCDGRSTSFRKEFIHQKTPGPSWICACQQRHTEHCSQMHQGIIEKQHNFFQNVECKPSYPLQK